MGKKFTICPVKSFLSRETWQRLNAHTAFFLSTAGLVIAQPNSIFRQERLIEERIPIHPLLFEIVSVFWEIFIAGKRLGPE